MKKLLAYGVLYGINQSECPACKRTKRGKLWYQFDAILSPVIRGLDSTEYMALIDKLVLEQSLQPRETRCCCRNRPYICCPVHGPVECFVCGSRIARCHAEGCDSAIEPDDGTPPERES